MSMISVENTCFSYEGREVVHHLRFTLEKGEYLCVVGENGSGKSTLMKGLLGLIAPTHGKIVFDESLKQGDIGYLPQRAEMQRDFPASVWEVVCSGLPITGPFLRKSEKQRALDYMDRLNILPLKKAQFMSLSGGQQQRVLLARALCAGRSLLLLDEPVAGLDPMITREMYDIINRLNKEENMTVLMISHDIAAAVQYADRILYLSKDHYFFGSTGEFCSSVYYRMFLGGGDND